MYIIAFVTATALQCIPIRIAWEHWDGEHHGKCINLNADAWASAAVNILLDLVVIVIPMRELSKLAMTRRRKVGIMCMFLGGGLYVHSPHPNLISANTSSVSPSSASSASNT